MDGPLPQQQYVSCQQVGGGHAFASAGSLGVAVFVPVYYCNIRREEKMQEPRQRPKQTVENPGAASTFIVDRSWSNFLSAG